jgi:sugar phosphate isomerase/epimerase
MNRRGFVAAMAGVAAARSLLADAGVPKARIGLAAFSCHLTWKAVAARKPGVKFTDLIGFYRYGRELGAEGVQGRLPSGDGDVARRLRALVEETGGCYEADVRLPKAEGEVAGFESEVLRAREAGATVARGTLMGTRRYEVFKTLEELREFRAQGERMLGLAEPVLRRHRLRFAIENHKDQTAPELVEMLRKLSSEWIGALVDTGNNIALLEEPHAVVGALAPFAMSVHLKDMAVQPYEDGFLLSEVPLGTGFLDLPRIVAVLRAANPALVFNLEMSTRDPLKVPCLTPGYWATFPDRRATDLVAALALVRRNPPRRPPPSIEGETLARQLEDEEANNRSSLAWMRRHFEI